MKCDKCQGEMKLLFNSWYCDPCEKYDKYLQDPNAWMVNTQTACLHTFTGPSLLCDKCHTPLYEVWNGTIDDGN